MWDYYNLFQPVLHLVEKTHDGVRTRRRWDHAATPFARLPTTNTLDLAVRERLERLYAETNPRALRHPIQAGLHALLSPRPTGLPAAAALAEPSAPARAVS